MNKPLVIGIGEVLWDTYNDHKTLGGAPANFAYHCAMQGCEGTLVSAVGNDEAGDEIRSELESRGISISAIQRNNHPSGIVTVTMTDGIPSYVIHENVAWDNISHFPGMEELASRADAVCFGSLAQRSPVSADTIKNFVRAMRPEALKIFDVNLRQHYFSDSVIRDSFEISNILKVSDEEIGKLCELLQIPCPADSLDKAIAELMERFHFDTALLTLGPHGCICFSGNESHCIPACDMGLVIDTVGCGDSFTAAFTSALLYGKSPKEAAEHGVKVAGFVSTRKGGMPKSIPDALILNG